MQRIFALEDNDLIQMFEESKTKIHSNFESLKKYEKDAYYFLKKGVANLAANSNQSLIFFKEALSSSPEDLVPNIKLYMVEAYVNLKNYKLAKKLAKELLKEKFGSKQYYFKTRRYFLEAHLKDGDYDVFLKQLTKYKKNSKQDRVYRDFYFDAAMILEKQKKYSTMFSFLEKLIDEYPITENAKRAFSKLIEYACQNDDLEKDSRYYFSYKILKKLGRHVDLDETLKSFLMASSWVPIKNKSKITKLDDLERVKFLIDLRLYKEAQELGKNLWVNQNTTLSHIEKEKLLSYLGKSSLKLYKHQSAAKYFSISKSITQNKSNEKKLSRYIASTYSYGGYKDIASILYNKIGPKTKLKNVRWDHFWNSYLNNDWDAAEKIFNIKKKYVPPRDYLQPQGPQYWQARVFENQKKLKIANELYQSILTKNSDDIYGIFISDRHPEILKKDSMNLKIQEGFLLNNYIKGNLHDYKTFEKGSSHAKLKTILNLYRVGLFEDVYELLHKIALSKLDIEQLLVIGVLSRKVNAHNIQYKSAKKIIFKNIVKSANWYQITEHQNKYTPIWRDYFPLAFKDIVFKVSKHLELDPFFLLSIMRIESYYQDHSISYVGARGLMQLMPYTALQIANRLGHDEFDLDRIWKPKQNIVYGAWYLKYLFKHFNENFILTAAAYNAGPFAVKEWIDRCNGCSSDEFIESIPYRETRRYVKRVIRTLARYYRIYQSRQQLGISANIPTEIPLKVDYF